MRVRLHTIALICAVSVVAAAVPLHADPLQFGLTPPDVELVPLPGGTASGVLVVYNRSSSPIHFRVTLQDVFIRPNGVVEVLKPGSTSWSVVRMARLQPAEFDLPPRGQIPVRVAVTVPTDVGGGLYGAIIVSPTPVLQGGGPRGTLVVVAPKLVARLLVIVGGTAVMQGAITNLLAAVLPGKSIAVKAIFRNTGNIHARVDGTVKLLRNGDPIASAPLQESVVLPGAVREFRVSLATGHLAPGSYLIRAVMDYGGDVLVAGETTFIVR